MPLDRRTVWLGCFLWLAFCVTTGSARGDDVSSRTCSRRPRSSSSSCFRYASTSSRQPICPRWTATSRLTTSRGLSARPTASGTRRAFTGRSIRWSASRRRGRRPFASVAGDLRADLAPYSLLVPADGRKNGGFHVYFLHQFPVNGVWMGRDYGLVQEMASLREVEGGIGEPIPRVTAHELGHGLGLPHRQNGTNLLASGTKGILLNAHEVEIASPRPPATLKGDQRPSPS